VDKDAKKKNPDRKLEIGGSKERGNDLLSVPARRRCKQFGNNGY